jgi:hypothetical protein
MWSLFVAALCLFQLVCKPAQGLLLQCNPSLLSPHFKDSSDKIFTPFIALSRDEWTSAFEDFTEEILYVHCLQNAFAR